MNKDAYHAGVRQALYDAEISISGQEKQASDLGTTQALFNTGVTKQAGKAQAIEDVLTAAPGLLERLLGRGRNALTSGKELAMAHPVLTGTGAGAGLGALTGGIAGGDLESALLGAGAGAGLGALGGASPATLAQLKALRGRWALEDALAGTKVK